MLSELGFTIQTNGVLIFIGVNVIQFFLRNSAIIYKRHIVAELAVFIFPNGHCFISE